MQQEELDLLIIGGGITGAGGSPVSSIRNQTGLIEMQDFAEGTSSLDQTCSWRYSLSEDI